MGALGVFLSLVAYPALQNRFGALSVYRACMACLIAVYLLFSGLSLLCRYALSQKQGAECMGVLWTGVALLLMTGRVAGMGFA